MKLTNSKLKQLIREIAEESEWDVSKRTAFPRVVAQILSALREAQDILEGGHLDEEEPVSPSTIENIQKILDHPALAALEEMAPPEEDEDDYEASLRRRYDKEEAAARREGPSTPMTPEEHAAYMALYDDEDEEDW